jgi:phosphoribosylanthranilate isomerase
VIAISKFEKFKDDIDAVRRNSLSVGARGSTKMVIQISRFEHCSSVERKDVGGFVVQVYSPTLVAVEKLRAICQQMEKYKELVPSATRSPRSRDFFDIHSVVRTCNIDLLRQENRELIEAVFAAKRVPVAFMKEIEEDREFHRTDFATVRDTVKPGVQLQDFDYYFDFVKTICKGL